MELPIIADILTLRLHHYRKVHSVTSGLAAIRALAKDPYDLVLMDCHMPEMDGLAATRSIRQTEHEHTKHTIIIAMTAAPKLEEHEACLAAGMDDFLGKPVRLNDLQAMLGRWFPQQIPEATSCANAEPATAEALTEIAAPAVLDPKALKNLKMLVSDDDPAFLEMLVTEFIKNTRNTLEELKATLAKQDAETVRRSVHSLKSSSASYGAMHFSSLCRAIEIAAKDHDLSEGDEQLWLINAEFIRVQKALSILVQEAHHRGKL